MKIAAAIPIFLISVAVPTVVPAAQALRRPAPSARELQTPSPISVYQLQDVWTDQDGKRITLAHFQGKPLVLAMIYTRCRDICPMIIADMRKIENGLPEAIRKQVRFALFSFDSEQDTPSQLEQFAAAHALDLNRWTLLTGSSDSVRMLAAVLGVRYTKQATSVFVHTSVITVLNSKGEIRFQQTGTQKAPAQMIATLTDLVTGQQ